MSQATSMKQLGARNMNCIVERMEWSNKMDLIAYGTEKGEVIIQRLNWQKIVTFPTPGDDVRVRSLSWQMDETLLAVGYSNGKVALLDAERETMISGLIYDDDIKKVYFSKPINCADYKRNQRAKQKFDLFFPKLPPLTSMDPSIKTIDHKSFAKGSPCFLVVIMNSSKVHLLLLGALQAGSIDLTQHVMHPMQLEVYDVRMNGDFNGIYALVRDGHHLKVLNFHNHVLEESMCPMLELATHCASILETKNYINDTLDCITEAWETVQLEMDNKLTKYAHAQPDSNFSADLLELFVFGFATFEIEGFLTEDLTEKGFKKMANSVDLSFSNLQTIVSRNLLNSGVTMFSFLNTTKGFGGMSHFYETLICPDTAAEAMRTCGAFLMKSIELQQTIDQAVHEMKLFHCWMYLAIMRLSHQDIPEDMYMTTENNLTLSEYLYLLEDGICENDDGTLFQKRKFNIEKISQYLENKELKQLAKVNRKHLWNRMLEENDCLRNCTLFYPHDKRLSLIQQRDKMLNAIDAVFRKPTESISSSFELITSIICSQLGPRFQTESEDFVRCSYLVSDANNCDMLGLTIGWQEAIVLEFDTSLGNTVKCTRIHLQPGPFTFVNNDDYHHLRFIDLQFYNDQAISMLLQTYNRTSDDDNTRPQSYFVQFSLNSAKQFGTHFHVTPHLQLSEALTVTHSIHDIPDAATFKMLDGVAVALAVSGSRKVATILSERKRKMTIFEMEIEDEEDDTEMSQNSFLDMSKDSMSTTNE